jgi:UDP:flavonoid glycosyltransferase YjiC (YdhE family)
VIVPTYSERESNARRVVAQGAAEMVLPTSDASGKKKKVQVAELAEKARKVLSTPSCRESAERLRAALQKSGGAPEAARLIEELVRSRATAESQ